MAKRVQRLGHPAAQAQEFLGKVREITVDTTANSLRVHDGVLKGGHELALVDLTNVAAATTNNNGKMTPAQVTELTNATAKNTQQDSRLTTNEADIDALETFRAYFSGVTGATSVNQADLDLLAGKSGASIAVMRGYYTGGSQTKAWFYSAAPPGWVLENPDANVRVLTIGNTGIGSSGGTQDPESGMSDTIQITPAGTVEDTNIDHTHGVSIWSQYYNPSEEAEGGSGDKASGNHRHLVSGNTGSAGGSHGHTFTGSLGTDSFTLTPRYARGGIYKLTA